MEEEASPRVEPGATRVGECLVIRWALVLFSFTLTFAH
jgi:hypothetical protein